MTDTTTDTPTVDAPEVDTLAVQGLPEGVERGSTEPITLADVEAPEVVTLEQPVPVQRDDAPGDDPTLVWFDETTPVGTGPEPPDPDGGGGTPATGATAGTPGTFTPAGADAPADLAACASLTATPATAWATGEHVVLGDATHAFWDGAAWAGGEAP
jgi:hypothetical protein